MSKIYLTDDRKHCIKRSIYDLNDACLRIIISIKLSVQIAPESRTARFHSHMYMYNLIFITFTTLKFMCSVL